MNATLRRVGLWLPILLAAWTSMGVAGPSAAADAKPTKLTGLLHNEDCTNFFYYQDFPAGKAGETVDRYVDVLAGAGVTVLLCNTNARRTNYRSDVWEAFWDGNDPNGPENAGIRGHGRIVNQAANHVVHGRYGYRAHRIDPSSRL